MANDYTTTQLQLTRNYLDGDIKSESIAAPDMADQDFVVEDNGDQVTQPAGGEAGCVGYTPRSHMKMNIAITLMT